MYAKQRRTTSNTTSALMSFFMRSRVRVLLIIAPVLFTVICIFLATASSAEDMEDARRSLPSVSAVAPVQWGQDIVSETTTTEANGEETTTAEANSEETTTTEADGEQTTKETTTTEANDEQSTQDTMTSSTMTTLSDAGLIALPINSSEITLDMSQNLTELNKTDEILLPQNITQLNLTEQNSTMQSSVQDFATEQLSSNNTVNVTMANETYSVVPEPNVDFKQNKSSNNSEMRSAQHNTNATDLKLSSDEVDGLNMTLISPAGANITFITELPPNVSSPILPSTMNISECTGNASLCAVAPMQDNESKQMSKNDNKNSTVIKNSKMPTSTAKTRQLSPNSSQFNASSIAKVKSQNSSFDRIETKVMKDTSKKIKETSKGIKETSKKIKEAAKGVKETAKGVKDRIMSTLNGIPVSAGKNATTRQYNETKKNSTGDFANQEPHKQDDDGNEEEQVVATDKNNDDGMEKDADDVQSAMDNKLESLSDDADKEGDLIMKDNWKTSIDQEEW
uniref:Uncharacterized protein n=1 Tax=Plectus sambesii TaxID=2011161 RepID=A0A914XGZ5_9BILA